MNTNKNLHSKSVLTEFARNFEEESKDNVLSKFVNKIYVTRTQPSSESPIPEREIEDDPETEASSSTNSDQKSADQSEDIIEEYQVDDTLGRTPLNVVKRISNLLAMKDKDLNDYKNTDLQKLWMPDSKSRECYDCSLKFNTFRRKHHCRLCGQIFCSKCCNQIIPGKIIKCAGDLRVCNYCSKVVLSYLKSSDINAELKSDLQALEEDLSSKFVATPGPSSQAKLSVAGSPHRKISVGYQEERLVSKPASDLSNADRKNILQQSNSLKTLYEEMFNSLSIQNRGVDLINFLLANQKCTNKQQAIAVLNAMIEAGFLVPVITQDSAIPTSSTVPESAESTSVEEKTEFDENTFYKLSKIENMKTYQNSSMDSIYETDDIIPISITDPNMYNKDQELDNSIMSSAGSKPLLQAYCDHEEMLLNQLLRSENLDISWSKFLINHCARIAHTIHPEFCQILDSMDVRNFVNIKKLSGGSPNECSIVGGVVFTKNVSHKDMKTKIDNPKVLLIQCPIAYQRVEGKFVTIENLILQEKEYLRNVTSRILSYAPDVVLVHKNVAGVAQDLLRDNGITLVIDVKQSVFERLSQCLQCDIVTSIDSNIGPPKLGTCKRFYTKSFTDENGMTKTLMFFDAPYSKRGCSLLLRGGSNVELAKVKKVTSFLLFARYNFRLELSFLLDAFAEPPPPKQSIFESLDEGQSPTEAVCSAVDVKEDSDSAKKKEKNVNIENVLDFSDPLRRSPSPSVPQEENVTLNVEQTFDHKFRTSLNSTILSISPHANFPLPYLETPAGRKCELRKYFPTELFFSKQWSASPEKTEKFEAVVCKNSVVLKNDINSNKVHNFLKMKITEPADSKDIQTALADYRRSGGMYKKVTRMKQVENKKSEVKQKVSVVETVKDSLDIYSHQRLPVLFCSFYHNTRELPTSFCAQPLLLDMHFYGQDDIMLGLFLERYCFRSSYICHSCKLPMMNHVRKYAHSMGVITVRLAEDPIKNENSNIMMTSRCTICHSMTPKVNMQATTWCMSFAKFLELKFHGHSYTRRNVGDDTSQSCPHSIYRDHIQYFSSNGVIVSFSYTPIELCEIKLPERSLQFMQPELIDNKIYGEKIKNFSVRGYEVYAKIHEKLANLSTDVESPIVASLKKVLNRDQLIFKHRVEVVYTLLSSPEVYATEINDAMIMMQKELADSIELWGPRLNEASVQVKNSHKGEILSHHDISEEIGEESVDEDYELRMSNSDELQLDNKKEKIDKKTIKRLLSALLPSSSDQNPLPTPFSSNEHFLSIGQFPILVHDQDVSSIIAHSLMSYEYKKSLESQPTMLTDQNASNNSPNLKRRNQSEGSLESEDREGSSSKENSDKKKSTNTNHVEICAQDATTQFSCKIYFAREFDELRSKCLMLPRQKSSQISGDAIADEIRKNYARSMSQSQKWEARGGKSGSKFNKTNDDKFILKEMSKQDVGEFEKFAPHYFEYINGCVQNKTPTLLAKIFGIYKVVIKKKEAVLLERSVLVIENLFCDRKITNKYDLKGSERNRLVDTTMMGETGDTVLLDENLIKASWTKPLYILSHTRAILLEAINRDASFLEKNDVMDYSLLVGLDRNFLIVGIIDYIRKYTLDKKIESYLKQVVDQTKLPTIVSPSAYKKRFIDAMDRYFLTVPDRWEGLNIPEKLIGSLCSIAETTK